MPRRTVAIFAPSPVLTVTIEENSEGPDVHIHAGGQGVWQARMLREFDIDVTLCAVLTGEPGTVLKHLIDDEEFTVHSFHREGRGAAYVHDRRGGQRESIVEAEGDPLTRHDIDEIYGITLAAGLEAGTAILSGPAGNEGLPADTYRRLAADLRTGGCRVVVDLAGERLAASLAGGVDVAKVSDEELLDDGRISEKETRAILEAMRAIRTEGADTVIVTRAEEPALVLSDEGAFEVTGPQMEVVDHRGAGDSLTAGVVATLVHGGSLEDAIITGAAAGAANVTRHGLATSDIAAIEALKKLVRIERIGDAS